MAGQTCLRTDLQPARGAGQFGGALQPLTAGHTI